MVYAKALRSLARSLWMIFAGWAFMVPAFCMLVLTMAADRKKWDFAGEAVVNMLWPWLGIVGGLLILYGKYSCFELRQPLEFGKPLPGAKELGLSFYADVAATLIRLVAKGAWRAKFGWLAIPFMLIGQVMFLLFLRKTADVVERQGLKRLVDFTLASFVLMVLCGGSCVALVRPGVNPFLFLGMGLGMLVFLFLTTAGYMLALALLARALRSFADYLCEHAIAHDDEEEATAGYEPEAS